MSISHHLVLGPVVTAFLAAAVLSPVVASAQERTAQARTGTLTCKGKGRVGMLIGSRETLACTYEPSGGGPRREFIGTVTNIGLDVGIKGPSIMVWGVLGSTTVLPIVSAGTWRDFPKSLGQIAESVNGRERARMWRDFPKSLGQITESVNGREREWR